VQGAHREFPEGRMGNPPDSTRRFVVEIQQQIADHHHRISDAPAAEQTTNDGGYDEHRQDLPCRCVLPNYMHNGRAKTARWVERGISDVRDKNEAANGERCEIRGTARTL